MSPSPELTTLTALAQALSQPVSLEVSLDAALGTVAEFLGLETGWVWLLDESSDEPRLAAARSLPAALRNHPEAMHGDCYCLSTFRAGDLRGAANVNVVWCSRLAKVVNDGAAEDTGLRCHASVPLMVGERRLGMLNVASGDWRVLSQDELNLLTTAGALVSLAVERTRLEAAGVQAAAAEERNRLAREIHDTLAQGLAGVTMQLEVADSLAARQADERLSQAITRGLQQAQATLAQARRSVLDLRATSLEERSLPEALRGLLAASENETADRTEFRLEIDGFEVGMPDLPESVEVGLYRIAQQALANVARHAGASRVIVRLAREPERVRLRIEDNGTGFDPSMDHPGRFGLTGMSERARLLNGTLTVESTPQRGTAIDVIVPLGASSLAPVDLLP
jgi:two-component system, NarL family, sensor kinase